MMSRDLAVLIPVHFPAEVQAETIRTVLERTLTLQELYCPRDRILLVVDEGTSADQVIRSAPPQSGLGGLAVHRLERNLGKAGAIRAGLDRLLSTADVEFIATRDCDGDHAVEDLPRIARLALELRSRQPGRPVAVFGLRPSLSKPMGWVREEWERLTNNIIVDCLQYLLARREQILDRRYWNGNELDLQAGYRLYDRAAATIACQALSKLPEVPEVYLFACEVLPFMDLSLEGGIVGQVGVSTRVVQPFSSYSAFSLSDCYGGLLRHLREIYAIPLSALQAIFDNHLVQSGLFFSRQGDDCLRCRSLLFPGALPVAHPSFL